MLVKLCRICGRVLVTREEFVKWRCCDHFGVKAPRGIRNCRRMRSKKKHGIKTPDRFRRGGC